MTIRQFAAVMLSLAAVACSTSGNSTGNASGPPVAIALFNGNNQTSIAAAPLVTPLAVVVSDAQGNGVAGVTVTWSITEGGGTATPATSVTDANGRARTIFTLGPNLGAHGLRATVAGVTGSVAFAEMAVFSTATQPASVAATAGTNQTWLVGTALPIPLAVTITDAEGNPVGGVPVDWTATLGGGNVAPARSATNVAGIATTTLTLGSVAGTNLAAASVSGIANPATFTAHSTGPATAIALMGGDGQVLGAGSALPIPLAIRVTSSQATNVAGAPVTWTVVTGGGHVTPVESGTDAGGQATAFFTLGPAVGSQTVRATVPGVASAVTFTLSATAAPPTPTPVLVATVLMPTGATFHHDTFIRDGLAFVCAWSEGVLIYDVGNGVKGGSPANPQLISQIVTATNNVHGGVQAHNAWWFHNPVTGQKRYLFVGQEGPSSALGGTASGDIHIVDVTNLAQPVEVGFIHIPGAGAHNFWMDEANQTLYAAYYNAGVVKIDVSGSLSGDMANRIVKSLPLGIPGSFYTWGVMLSGGTLYATDMLSGFWAIDPATLTVKGGGNNVPDRYGSDQWVIGAFAYSGTWSSRGGAAGRGNVVKVWSLSGAGIPALTDSIKIANVGTISDVSGTLDGKALVVTTEGGTGNGLYVYDRVNPAKPQLRGFAPAASGLHTGKVAVINGRTYVFAARDPSGSAVAPAMYIYDITDLVQ